MSILTDTDFLITAWSGGTTTQLYIFPEDATLAERNFDWRISSAVVAVEESDFTLFEGYERILIPLQGKLELEHQAPGGIFRQQVGPFELARFSGSWKTTGKGKLTDFNLIFLPDYNPKVHIINFPSETTAEWEEHSSVLFLQEGSCVVNDQVIQAPALFVNEPKQELVVTWAAGSRIISIAMTPAD